MAKITDSRTTLNGEPVFSAFLHSKGRKLGLPVSGTFELTARCNFNCKMCYIHSQDCNRLEKEEISAEEWIELGKKARDAGMVFLLLTGGEPLIRKDFAKIYKGLNELGFVISVNTNASLIDEKTINLFREYTPHRLNISLYGASNETYERLCENACFEKVIENIRKLKATGVQIKLNSSLTPYNCCDIDKIYSLAEELKLNIKTAAYMYPQLRNDKEKSGVNEGRFSAFEGASCKVRSDILKYGAQRFTERADAAKNGISLLENECVEVPSEGEIVRCRAGCTSFWVNWQGYMSACGIIPDEEYNVFETDFETCWNAVREKTKAIRLPSECVFCKYKNICSVCAAACYCETGSFDKKPEYLCRYTEHIAEIMEKEAERLKGEINAD